MSHEQLYQMFTEAMQEQGIDTVDWSELSAEEREGWTLMASWISDRIVTGR